MLNNGTRIVIENLAPIRRLNHLPNVEHSTILTREFISLIGQLSLLYHSDFIVVTYVLSIIGRKICRHAMWLFKI